MDFFRFMKENLGKFIFYTCRKDININQTFLLTFTSRYELGRKKQVIGDKLVSNNNLSRPGFMPIWLFTIDWS